MEKAMEKQPACAAPMSSSGFVPGSPSKRVRKEYGFALSAPEPVLRVPEPSLRLPFQTADALCFIKCDLFVGCMRNACASNRGRSPPRPEVIFTNAVFPSPNGGGGG